jgi:hypothetical protein
MANFVARYRGSNGHYAGVERADAELERYLVLKSQHRTLNMKIERFAGHHEAREALVLSVAGVTAIMLIESLILLILY